jgi:uncharacterized repeat protein (TIGR01451 family)
MNFGSRILHHASIKLVTPTLGCWLVASQGAAQSVSLSITPSASQISFGNQVTYTILVTNGTGLTLQNLFVTNTFPPPTKFIATTAQASPAQVFTFTNVNNVTFFIQQFFPGGTADLTVTTQPGAAGPVTNFTAVFSQIPLISSATNVVVEVTGPPADLGASILGHPASVLVNDWMNYKVIATNGGPNSASGVMLTNQLPPGAQLISISPTNQTSLSNNAAVLNLGTLTNGESRAFTLLVQPTQPGLQTFQAAIAAGGIEDTNLANNIASLQVNVGAFLSTNLIATNASAMAYNPQTGLMQQTVRLANIGTSSVPAARVIVSGLTNRLYNAAGTNNGNPFVVYGGPLAPGQSVELVMDYFVPTRLPIVVPDSAYQAVGVPTNTPPIPPGTPLQVTRIVALSGGNILVEFTSIPGRSYTILYSDSINLAFTDALAAQPPIVASADRVQWIDDGPPKTVSAPSHGNIRMYRVLLNP